MSGLQPGLTMQLGEGPSTWSEGFSGISIGEAAFGFIEPHIIEGWPAYRAYGHWGATPLPRAAWLNISASLENQRRRLLMDEEADVPAFCGFDHALVTKLFQQDPDLHHRKLARMIGEVVTWLRDALTRCDVITVYGV